MNITLEKSEYASIGVVELYELVAKKLGIVMDESDNFDCKEICVAKDIQDEFFNHYEAEGSPKPEVAMILLMFGPKVDENLKDGEVSVTPKFITKNN